MDQQSPFIFRTTEQDQKFAISCGKQAAMEVLKSASEPAQALMKLSNPKIQLHFEELPVNTLRKWCAAGKLGQLGTDGNWWVTIEEIRNVLFAKAERREKKKTLLK